MPFAASRLSPASRPRRALAPPAIALVALTLLAVTLPVSSAASRGATVAPELSPPARPSPSAPATVPPAAAPVAPQIPFSATTAGSVVRTAFLNYNSSLTGNFPSTVWNWEVGPPAVDPATGDVWLPTKPIALSGILAPTFAPALVYDPATNQSRTVPQLVNTSAFAFDAANGLLYATDPLNDTVAIFSPTTDTWAHPALPVGSDPSAILYDPASKNLYVANAGSSNVTVINGSTNS
ncbi:MAG TPA: hypothetical protein VEL82_08485, partial [Thermoplasmata archaeon]|nr:hypothetical protein [Thermoplasmata archaeon]